MKRANKPENLVVERQSSKEIFKELKNYWETVSPLTAGSLH